MVYKDEYAESVHENEEQHIDVENGNNQSSKSKTRRRGIPSNVMGHTIVNAVTGVAYPSYWKVGSRFENLLWKVCDASFLNNTTEPQFYFYDSPEQAHKHRRMREPYDEEIVKNWHSRVDRISKLFLQDKE